MEPWENIQEELVYSLRIEGINPLIINKLNVKLAPESWHVLFWGVGVLAEKKCLLYRSPSQRRGELKQDGQLTFFHTTVDCADGFFTPIYRISGISNLIAKYRHGKLELTFSEVHKKGGIKNISREIEFLNLGNENSLQKMQRTRRSKINSGYKNEYLLGGVRIIKGQIPSNDDRVWDSVNYASGKQVFCHRVDRHCETTQNYTCNSCPYGWYETVGSECASGGHKLCGINRCGARGEPACPRGRYLAALKKQGQCEPNSLWGYCQQGLSAYCDENNVLVCH